MWLKLFVAASVAIACGPAALAESPDIAIQIDDDDAQMATTAEFSVNGKKVGKGRAGMEAVVKRVNELPAGASIVWGPNYARCGCCSGDEPRNVAAALYPELWTNLEKIASQRKAVICSSYPYPGPVSVTRTKPQKGQLKIEWWNYRGPGTPHSDVLYVVDGAYVGRGEAGFDKVLQQVGAAHEGTAVHIPRYKHSGRWALESFTPDALDAANQKLREAYPFVSHKTKLGKLIKDRKLKLELMELSPVGESPTTALGWDTGDRYAETFVGSGHIVRFDERPRAAKAVLAWQGEAVTDIEEPHTATITLDGKPLGKDVAAFAKAIIQLAALPEGSVVQVRVCLRTKPPFTCPLVYEGYRHMERTGYEPYVALYPWLLDVARQRKLEIEWIPDEAKSCFDCQLNR